MKRTFAILLAAVAAAALFVGLVHAVLVELGIACRGLTPPQFAPDSRVALQAFVDTPTDTLAGGRKRKLPDEPAAKILASGRKNIVRKQADGRHAFS